MVGFEREAFEVKSCEVVQRRNQSAARAHPRLQVKPPPM